MPPDCCGAGGWDDSRKRRAGVGEVETNESILRIKIMSTRVNGWNNYFYYNRAGGLL